MDAIVYAVEANAQTIQTRVNNSFGYPACYCGRWSGSTCQVCGNPCIASRVRGDGRFSSECTYNVTTDHAQYFKHPTLNLWAYPVTSQSNRFLSAGERLLIETLTSDWFA